MNQARRRIIAGVMLGLGVATWGAFGQQPPGPSRSPATPAPDPRIRIMQGQGAAMDLTDARARMPQLQGEVSTATGVGTAVQPGTTLASVAAADCAACHDRQPVPIGFHDDPGTGFDGPSLSRRSWAAWWEVNREPFLREARSKRQTPIQPLTATPAITAALLRATGSSAPEVRGEAVLALGRLRANSEFETIRKLTQDPDQRTALRAWAAIGLLDSKQSMGFLSTAPPAQGFERIGWTVAVGLLSEPADSMWETIKAQTSDAQASAEARRLAIWAMRTHQPAGTHELLKDVIHTSTSRELVAEAIAGLPASPTPGDIAFLGDVVAGGGQATDLASLSQFGVDPQTILNPATSGGGYYSTNSSIIPDPFISDGELLALGNPRPAGPGNRVTAVGRSDPRSARPTSSLPSSPQTRAVIEGRTVYLYLREAAVRALGEYSTVDADTRGRITRPVVAGSQGVRRFFLPQDVLTIGRIGVLEDYYPLSDRLEVNLLWHPGFPEPTPAERMKRPGRGSAAIAIGLLLDRLGGRPVTVPDLAIEQADFTPASPLTAPTVSPLQRGRGNTVRTNPAQPNSARLNRGFPNRSTIRGRSIVVANSPTLIVQRSQPDQELLMHLQKRDETSELRAACAMALSIGGQKQRAADMKRVLDSLKAGDAPVFGYTMLALGLWGDADVLGYSARQLGPAANSLNARSVLASHQSGRMPAMPLGEVLARRAAAQGMAALGDPRAIPILIGQWGRNPAVDVELARAIAWCQNDSPSPGSPAVEFGRALAELLEQDAPPTVAASAAASLGALFDQDASPRLDRILAGQPFLTRGHEPDAQGRMDLTRALQQEVLGLGNPHYYLTAFAAGR